VSNVISISFDQFRVAKRVEQSCGYLELGMPAQALANLDGVATDGQLQGALEYVRGQALRMQERFDDAVEPLACAARLLPEPASRHAWMVLAECHRAMNRSALVANTLAMARGANLPRARS
jgi:hypothetical protein